MFDEQPPKTSEAPGNVPTEPADMFAGIKDDADNASDRLPDALSSGLLKKKESSVSVMPDVTGGNKGGLETQTTGSSVVAKIFIALAFIAVVGGLGFGAWWLYQQAQDKTAVAPVIIEQQQFAEPAVETIPEVAPITTPIEQPAAVMSPSSTTRTNNDSILFGSMLDTDKDSLDDVREREIGTDPLEADTDGDGLTDGAEVLIWNSNPLKTDTDGDTYLDGAEVKNGFTPTGPGRIIPNETTVKTTSTID